MTKRDKIRSSKKQVKKYEKEPFEKLIHCREKSLLRLELIEFKKVFLIQAL